MVLIQLRSSPPSMESNKGTLCSDCQSCARATPELYSQPEDELLARIDLGIHLDPTDWLAWVMPTSRLRRRVGPKRRVGRGSPQTVLPQSPGSLPPPVRVAPYGQQGAHTVGFDLFFAEPGQGWDRSRDRERRKRQGAEEAFDSFRESTPKWGHISRLLRHAVPAALALFFAPHYKMGPEAYTGGGGQGS